MHIKKKFSHIPPAQISMMLVVVSVWIVVSALFMQFFMDMRPCSLCIWQRYPYVAAMFGSVLVPLRYVRISLIYQSLCFFTGSMIALYHSGIERQWWSGFSGCSSSDIAHLSITELHLKLLETQIVKCDEIAWSLFGLSLTNYNFIITSLLGIFALFCVYVYDKQTTYEPA